MPFKFNDEQPIPEYDTISDPDDNMVIKPNDDPELSLSLDIDSMRLFFFKMTLAFIRPMFIPDKIIHNRKTAETIVIWKDGTKTTVKPMAGMPESEMSKYSAFTAALAKKIYGSNTQVNKIADMTIEPVKKVRKKKS